MFPHRIALIALLLALLVPSSASATIIGVGDRADAPVAPSRALHARTYRVVIDPNLPLASYDARIAAHRAAGQEPQLVIGGTGTRNHASSRGIVAAAVAAQRRWPYAYSVSVINEVDLSGMGVCEYVRTYRQAAVSLKVAGARRVTFGEWSPHGFSWHKAALTRCGRDSAYLRSHKLYVAWHAWTMESVDWGRDFKALHKALGAKRPGLLATEAGSCGSACADSDTRGMRYWRAMFRAVKRDGIAQVVVWGVSYEGGAWSSDLITKTGRIRPAFHAIAASAR